MQELVVCVVGLSMNQKEPFGTRPGVGKSCLCFRFAYPGIDNYVDNHPSLLALHEFENPVINNAHFLYWGSPVKAYTAKGSEVEVRFHLLEHTVFYQDITSHPFNSLTRPDVVDQYMRRIVGSVESPGKHSYYSRDDITMTDRYTKFQYPSNLTKLARGYVVVFDASLTAGDLEMQCKRVEPVIEYLCKGQKKLVLAVTKRDSHKLMSLEKAHELQRKFHIPLVETSASDNLNIEEVFRILARRVLTKKLHGLSDQVTRYDEAARQNLIQRGSARRSFQSFLKKKVSNCDDHLSSVQSTEEYKECRRWIGTQQTDLIFVQNSLELYNTKVDTYAGAMEDTVIRREFLEDFVYSRSDFGKFRAELNQ